MEQEGEICTSFPSEHACIEAEAMDHTEKLV